GVEVDGLTFKPNLQNLLRGRFRALREQVSYKLPALLEARAQIGASVPETLFGDDAEADAFIYSLYADFLAGRASADLVREVLVRRGHLRRVAIPALAEAVLATGDLTMPFGPAHKVIASFADRLRGLGASRDPEPAPDEAIDYLSALEEDVSAKKKRKKEEAA